MKKVLFFAAALVVISLTSCKKDTCTYTDGTVTNCDGCSKLVLEAWQASCKAGGGKVSTK